MSETSVLAILASVGIVIVGTISADAAVLAQAVQRGEPKALLEFAREFPESTLAPDALVLAAEVMKDRTDDSRVSKVNPALACKLSIRRTGGGKAEVTWEVGGATSFSLHPLGFKKHEVVPIKGQKVIDFSDFLRVDLTAKDAAGNDVKCSVVLHTSSVNNDTTIRGPHTAVVSV